MPSTNTFLAMYFTLTGLHALHVVAGVIANAVGDRRRRPRPASDDAGRVRALALYWAFVDVVWLVIFRVLYLS